MIMTEENEDLVNHPSHYTSNESGIETIEITSPLRFSQGNAVKYIARSDLKGKTQEDLEKARWYLNYVLENTPNTGAERGISRKEESFVEGADISDNLKEALRSILSGTISGGSQANHDSIAKAVGLIEKDLND